MANDAAGTSWDITVPILSSDRREGSQEIRGLRAGVGIRMSKEHRALNGAASPADGGEHYEGSAVAYHETDAPTLRPNAGPALVLQDDGRLWVDNSSGEVLKVWDGATLAWINVSGSQIATGSFDQADLTAGITGTVGFVADLVVAHVASFSFAAALAAEDPQTISQYTNVNRVQLIFALNGTDIDITKGSATTVSLIGTGFWMALKV